MPNKFRFIADNAIDNSYIICDPMPITTLPETNITVPSRARICRVNSNNITFTGFIDITNISSLIICDHNLSSTATITLNLYSDTYFTQLLHTESIVVGDYAYNSTLSQNNIPIWFIEIGDVAAYTLQIVDTSLNHIDIGRFILGKYIETKIGVTLGELISVEDNTNQYRTDSGTLFSNYKSRAKLLEFNLDIIMESERPFIQQALASVGLRKQIFISIFPEGSINRINDYSCRCNIIKIPEYTEQIASIYNSSFVFKEI